MKKNIFSFDAETVGLQGKAFSIAATITSPNGIEMATFAMRRELTEAETAFAATQIFKNNDGGVTFSLPACIEQSSTLPCIPFVGWDSATGVFTEEMEDRAFRSLLAEFSKFYMAHKGDSVIIAHCPNPVEARLLIQMHSLKLIGDWDMPFPLIGIEGLLDHAGEDPTEATGYAEKHGLPLPEGNAHNPLFDCRLATTMYRHLKGW